MANSPKQPLIIAVFINPATPMVMASEFPTQFCAAKSKKIRIAGVKTNNAAFIFSDLLLFSLASLQVRSSFIPHAVLRFFDDHLLNLIRHFLCSRCIVRHNRFVSHTFFSFHVFSVITVSVFHMSAAFSGDEAGNRYIP